MSAVLSDVTNAVDTLTVLHSADKKRLAKRWEADGSIADHSKGYLFTFTERQVGSIRELSALLTELEADPFSCIIRGRFVGAAAAAEEYAKRPDGHHMPMGKHRRLSAVFRDQPLHYLLGDIDGYVPEGLDPVLQPVQCIEQFIAKRLPSCFHGVSYHWSLSGSAGHERAAGKLKAHVTFRTTRPFTSEELDAWNESVGAPLDGSVLNAVQINYTAAPVFADGVQSPVPVRSGFADGWAADEVDLVISPLVLLRARGTRKSRAEMVDPRDKDTVHGLFCRTFEIEDVVDRWLSEVFEFVTEDRLNFLQSASGAGQGARVTDNRQGIYNSHSSDPFSNKAANKWDLVRHYKFGHLDVGQDAFEILDIRDRPSEQAMREFARTLPEMQETAVQEVVDSSATHRAAIEAATTELTVREICARIAADGAVDALSRDTLVGVIVNKLRDINGVKPTKKAVEALVAMTRVARTGPALGPEWVRPWCYVAGEARFFNRNTKELVTREAFDASFGRAMDPADDGTLPQPSRVACDTWQIPVVYERMYLPSAGDLFTLDGREYANDYRPESEPIGVLDPAVNAVLMRHVELLIPDAGYRALFLQWAAWVVRNPGKKVLWAVLVKGVEGDGKSVLGSMIAQAMGHINVGIISPETMAGSNFNDWAKGRCVNVLEEIKIPGHRHDVYNKIKPLITNPRIEVHGKGKASTTVINTTNYIGFTNHDDALPLDDKDRRHFVLFTPWRDIGGMHEAVAAMGLGIDAYWDQLWDPIKNRPDAVRGFFESIDLSGFNPNSRAPATSFKSALVAAGDLDDAEGHARFWVEEGCFGVSGTVVSSGCLTKRLAEMDPQIRIHTSRVRKVLAGMGFDQVAGQVKWKGYPHRVWVSSQVTRSGQPVTSDWIRSELDKTDLGGGEDFLK